jgi:DNA-binding CsgD family transcriptional regulator
MRDRAPRSPGKRPEPPEPEQLSALIGDIYDASLDLALWPSVLQAICGFVRGSMANIYSQDAIDRTANRYFTWGHDPHYVALYLEQYAALNPMLPAQMFFPAGAVYSMADIISHEEMRETRFYREWLEPQGYVDFVGCNLDKSATSVAPLAVVRHERDGVVDDEARRRMWLVAPHVQRAIRIGKVIDLAKVETAAFIDVLDRLAAGVLLADADGRIVHANASGRALLEARAVVQDVGGRIVAADARANLALREVVAKAAAGDAALGVRGIAAILPGRDGTEHVADCLTLTSGARLSTGATYGAVVAIFIRTATLDLQSPVELLSRRYDLTAGELRVLLALIDTGTVADVARNLGISEGTVRNHLHRLFEKTRTRRQAELVRLVSGLASSLRM